MPQFLGWSTVNQNGSVTLKDAELIKQDLLNEFNTFKGERVMDENFGFIAWNYIGEQFTEYVASVIERDARRIIESDPRCEVIKIQTQEYKRGLVFAALIRIPYLNENITVALNLV